MEMNLTLLLVCGALIGCGVYLLLERSLTRVLVGLVLISNGVNLAFLAAGGPAGELGVLRRRRPRRRAWPTRCPRRWCSPPSSSRSPPSAFLLAMAHRSWQLHGTTTCRTTSRTPPSAGWPSTTPTSDSYGADHRAARRTTTPEEESDVTSRRPGAAAGAAAAARQRGRADAAALAARPAHGQRRRAGRRRRRSPPLLLRRGRPRRPAGRLARRLARPRHRPGRRPAGRADAAGLGGRDPGGPALLHRPGHHRQRPRGTGLDLPPDVPHAGGRRLATPSWPATCSTCSSASRSCCSPATCCSPSAAPRPGCAPAPSTSSSTSCPRRCSSSPSPRPTPRWARLNLAQIAERVPTCLDAGSR